MIDITIDFNSIGRAVVAELDYVGSLSYWEMAWYFFLRGGFLIPLAIVYQNVKKAIASKKRGQFASTLEFSLLAIEPPKNNDQLLTAVEKIFISLTATVSGHSTWEKFWHGKFNPPFSFEIVSLDGYIQFLVRAPKAFSEYVAALFYAQYPECRVYEIEDYAARLPETFGTPTSQHECWGTELVLAKPMFVPIKTYAQGTNSFSSKNPLVFDTPFANLLEVMSRLKRGEFMGMQLNVTPTDDGWQAKAADYAKELQSGKASRKMSPLEEAFVGTFRFAWGLLYHFSGMFFQFGEDAPKKEEKKEVSESQKALIGAVMGKAAKPGYLSVVRVLYVARKESFNKARGVVPFLGSLKQFAGLNSFKPGDASSTKGSGWRAKTKAATLAARQKGIVSRFKSRDGGGKEKPYVLNTEELASLFHLPISGIRAPSVVRVAAKTAEPPAGLPVEAESVVSYGYGEDAPVISPENPADAAPAPEAKEEKDKKTPVPNDTPPANLPFEVE